MGCIAARMQRGFCRGLPDFPARAVSRCSRLDDDGSLSNNKGTFLLLLDNTSFFSCIDSGEVIHSERMKGTVSPHGVRSGKPSSSDIRPFDILAVCAGLQGGNAQKVRLSSKQV